MSKWEGQETTETVLDMAGEEAPLQVSLCPTIPSALPGAVLGPSLVKLTAMRCLLLL